MFMVHAQEMRYCMQRLHCECPRRASILLDPCQFLAGTNNFHMFKINRFNGSAKVTFHEMVQWDFSLYLYFLILLSFLTYFFASFKTCSDANYSCHQLLFMTHLHRQLIQS